MIDLVLENDNRDVALRIEVDFEQSLFGRKSKSKGTWSEMDTETIFPVKLKPGRQIRIQILFTVNAFLIAINHKHVAVFNHRLPYHQIKTLEVHGDLQDVNMERKIVTDYPSPVDPDSSTASCDLSSMEADSEEEDHGQEECNVCSLRDKELVLPFIKTMEKGFLDLGYNLNVVGRIRNKPQLISISLQSGSNVWPLPTVALNIELRFNKPRDGETGEPIISRNSFAEGKWVGEQKSELSTGLRPSSDFHLVVMRGRRALEVYINNKPVTEFAYYVNPKHVDTVVVKGDLKLFSVCLTVEEQLPALQQSYH